MWKYIAFITPQQKTFSWKREIKKKSLGRPWLQIGGREVEVVSGPGCHRAPREAGVLRVISSKRVRDPRRRECFRWLHAPPRKFSQDLSATFSLDGNSAPEYMRGWIRKHDSVPFRNLSHFQVESYGVERFLGFNLGPLMRLQLQGWERSLPSGS